MNYSPRVGKRQRSILEIRESLNDPNEMDRLVNGTGEFLAALIYEEQLDIQNDDRPEHTTSQQRKMRTRNDYAKRKKQNTGIEREAHENYASSEYSL